jgi:arabinosaccharide transport system substrate-binding protein
MRIGKIQKVLKNPRRHEMRKRSVILLLLVITGGLVFGGGTQEKMASKELTFDTFVADHQKYYEMMAGEFSKKYPEAGLVLKMTTTPVDQLHDKLTMSLAAGSGAPDIFDMNIQWSGVFLKQNPQYFYPLDDLVAKYKDVMHPARIKAYTDPEGHVLGLPTHVGAGVMYYNVEMCNQAGVDFNNIPYWKDWVEIGKKVTRADQGVWWTANQNVIPREFALLTMQNGGYLIDPKGKITVDEPPAVEALQFIHDNVLVHKISVIAPNGDFHDPNFWPMLNGNKIFALPYAQWYMIRFKNFVPDLKGKVAVRPLPLWRPNGNTSATMGGTGTVITKQCKNVELAKQFLEFSKLTYDANVKIWTNLGFDPPRMDVYDDPKLLEPDPYFNNEPVMIQLKKAMTKLVVIPIWPQFTELWMKLGRETIFNVLEGTKAPAEALKEAADAVRG